MSTRISICPECGNRENNVPTEEGEKILESSHKYVEKVEVACINGHIWEEHRKTSKGRRNRNILW